MTISDFCKTYLISQGVSILAPCPRQKQRVVGKREGEMSIPMPQAEHGDPA